MLDCRYVGNIGIERDETVGGILGAVRGHPGRGADVLRRQPGLAAGG